MNALGVLLGGLAGLVLAPAAGALAQGLDRRLTARLQRRMGPPLLQPVYDLAKLWGKQPQRSGAWIGLCAWGCLAGSALASMLFFAGQDLLLVMLVQAAGAVFLVLGAMSAPSPYSRTGAQREVMLMLAYEPVLLLVAACLGLGAGGFTAADVLAAPEALLPRLPLAFAALLVALTVKLRKSPFDAAASAHAHQELVRGVYTEYSGPHLALVELAHCFDTALLLGLCGLFWATSWWAMVLLAALALVAEIAVDNACARLTWRAALASAWGAGVVLCVVNLFWLRLG
ncbi:MAG: NADH-quinone oxidoreductase subunit H [Desulfovibrionaceae bacterium]